MSDTTMTLTVTADPVGELADAAARNGYAIGRIVERDGAKFTVDVDRAVDLPLDETPDDDTVNALFTLNVAALLDADDA